MRPLLQICFVVLAPLAVVASLAGQITSNPIPEPILKRGLAVEIKDLVRLPETRGLRPPDQDTVPPGWARVSYVRESSDGRLFANDARGFLYLLDGGTPPRLYADAAAAFPLLVYKWLVSGFNAFAFHPEFATNGLFYTMHTERASGTAKPHDFIPPGYTQADVTFYNVITEWHASNPAAPVFEGTRRELLRVAFVVDNVINPMGAVEFNPTARPGDADYGLLYTSGNDLGFDHGGGPNDNNPSATQRLDSLITAILRIDPRPASVTGGVKGVGDYTIPPSNHFAADGDPATLGEIYAYGFRNGHRLSWDTDGTLFVTDIGMNNVEEINIVHNGGNYGWMKREGYWENSIGARPDGALNKLFPLPADVLNGHRKDGFSYPVAVYDHDEGNSVTAGFAYRGRIAALRGKFVFGDIRRGRVFAADIDALKKADDGVPETVAPIEEIQLFVRDATGKRVDVTFQELVNKTMGASVPRADLHIGRRRDGELFFSSRQDGIIRILVP